MKAAAAESDALAARASRLEAELEAAQAEAAEAVQLRMHATGLEARLAAAKRQEGVSDELCNRLQVGHTCWQSVGKHHLLPKMCLMPRKTSATVCQVAIAPNYNEAQNLAPAATMNIEISGLDALPTTDAFGAAGCDPGSAVPPG